MRNNKFSYSVTTLVGSRLRNIFALRNNYSIGHRYRMKVYISILVAGIFEIFNLIECLLWQKRINTHKLKKPPVFIIGFWRSGTTLLHNLMCLHPEASYTTTFQTVFPNLMLTQSFWLKPFTNHFLPVNRPYDKVRMDMDFPQEEEFGMMNLQSSTIYKFFLFPLDFDRIIEQDLYTEKLPLAKLAIWKKKYASMIAKAEFNTGRSIYIGKNPCHITRIALLKQMYPDARFIFIHRDPYQVNESLYGFIHSIFPGVQLQKVPPDFTREKVVKLYKTIMNSYLHDRQLLPASDLIEIRMDEFIKDKTGCLREIYETFDLGDFDGVLPKIEKYLNSDNKKKNEPKVPSAETVKLVNLFASDIIEMLGYQKITD